MFILSSISSGLEFWSVTKLQYMKILNQLFLKRIKLLGEISNNWPNDILGTNVYKTPEFCW